MRLTVSNFIALAFGAIVLTGCVKDAKEELVSQGAVPLTQAEVLDHVSDKTEVWTKGAGYYGPGGDLRWTWEGDSGSGRWAVKDDGRLCMVVQEWGGTDICHAYVLHEGEITLVFEGDARVAETRPGNQLSAL
ncbi:MAG: DUF995 domain-containing protein [Pseudomonadota bacterium]